MIDLRASFEPRRRKELREELEARARVWLPEWRPHTDQQSDFVTALLDIAARLQSEVTQRLDKVPEKAFRGFLYWLGVRSQASRSARLPVVFGMSAGAERILAPAEVQLQATPAPVDAADAAAPITFETESPMMVTPGRLASVVGVNPAGDEFFLPGEGYSALEAPTPGPSEWQAISDAVLGSDQIQLEPAAGLDALPKLLHVTSIKQYRVTKVDGNLVTVDPPLETAVGQDDVFESVPVFSPFPENKSERNRQEHALYIGSESSLNLPTKAIVAIDGLGQEVLDAEWTYWGKKGTADPVTWQTLKPEFKAGRIVLSKDAGSVEMTEVGGKKSRWLRALKPAGSVQKISQVSKLKLVVNCDKKPTSCPPKAADRSTVAVEAIANTTPLVIDIPFFPLGREPKLFDAFYIGSPEAFSKKGASVKLCLQTLDSATDALMAIGLGTSGFVMICGVGRDGQLHRLAPSFNPSQPIMRATPVRPPFTDQGIASVPAAAASLNSTGTAPVSAVSSGNLMTGNRALVGVAAGNDAWIWSQLFGFGANRWHRLGPIFDLTSGTLPSPDDKARIILLTTATGIHVVGLNRGVLYETDLGANWETSTTPPVWKSVPVPSLRTNGWKQIVPIFNTTSPLSGANFADGWLAVDATGVAMFKPDSTGTVSQFPTSLTTLGAVNVDVTPVAVRRASSTETTVVVQKGTAVVAWSIIPNAKIAELPLTTAVGAFNWSIDSSSRLAILFSKQRTTPDEIEAATWFPRETTDRDPKTPYTSVPIQAVRGGPVAIPVPKLLVIPGLQAVHSMPFDLNALSAIELDPSKVASAYVIASPADPFAIDDFVETRLDTDPAVIRKLTATALPNGPDRYWLPLEGPIDEAFTSVVIWNCNGAIALPGVQASHTTTPPLTATVTLATGDTAARVGGVVIVAATIAAVTTLSRHAITATDNTNTPTEMTLLPAITGVADGGSVDYVYVTQGASAQPADIRPAIDVQMQPADAIAAIVANGAYVSNGAPTPNLVDFTEPPGALPVDSLILKKDWTTRPTLIAGKVVLIGNGLYGVVTSLADTKAGNPKLSWEYWDGQAWWKIQNLNDGTGNLQTTGLVTFCVPSGLQPTDVSGRTSHWIRARLVEGDYGKEKVTLKSTTTGTTTTTTTQTVERDLSGITPPQLASIDLRYSVCCPVVPDFVITKDANAFRNQSEANTIDGATVEFFVPLTETIRQAANVAATDAPAGDANDRAIFLGFDQEIADGPISVLFLMDDGTHDEAFPVRVDVLRETGFERIVANDQTRGLNESGVLTFNLASPPPPGVSLFGDERRWLRVRPREGFTGEWRPQIRSAYLNGTFARAAETQRLERLGSSDGSPKQRVFLARPPVIMDSLELRVREPLGDEELERLRDLDPKIVRDDLAYPGRWVLWGQVADPDDAGKDERVYSLDHETGEITFGDGAHGMIPPIGTDSILAVHYKKGGGLAANRVNAWSQVNLITSLSGVQTVAAPDGAAGGSDPQDAETVVRFAPANQFMRNRALTLRDFEMQALQFSPEVAQAHAFQTDKGIRLIVVMTGRDPVPPQRVRRELTEFLGERTVPMLATHGAIVIDEPETVSIRVDLTLAIERVERSAVVAPEATRRIAALLDAKTGGLDGTGWPLGETPTETDVAAVLDDLADLEEIRHVKILDADTDLPIAGLKRHQLATLASEGVTFRFELVEDEEEVLA